VRRAARSFLWLAGIPLQVEGLSTLARRPAAVIAVNHSSHLDGLVLAAALPQPARFVVKRELAAQRVAGPFLRRLGALFVERFAIERSVEDARRVQQAMSTGGWFVFFPEGTFRREPGLLAFHLGAFQAAAGAGVPVVPAVVNGTRSILCADRWFPRRGSVRVRFGEARCAASAEWSEVVALRAATRAWILASCAEPDREEEPRASALEPTASAGDSASR
jgi:1-acyl-sn-glycerol-3-phosphate acyltransferase